jgi:hypothetical protein
MSDARRNTTTPAAGWSGMVWIMIILSAWSGTASAGMATAAAPTALDAGVTPAAVDEVDGEVALPEELSSSDWQSIRAAYEAKRHAVQQSAEQPGSYHARNPGQQWLSTFNAEGVAISPDHGRWQFGLRLAGWGHAGHERPAAPLVGIDAHGQRTVYRYSDGLEEWFVNDQRGLEHGFTVHQPPAGSGDALRFALDITGELSPRVAANGRDVALFDAQGKTVLNYNKLQVWDAEGRMLAANFSSDNSQLILSVDTSAARFPITIDPLLQQQAYLKASNTEADDDFGRSLAIAGDTVVVGASGEDSNATGVNGNQGDNSALGAGAAYVFVRDGSGNWVQQAYLKASNSELSDRFGRSVAIAGDTVVIGAYFEHSNATGVNGNQSDNSADQAGAAYVFVRDGAGNWSQQAYLKASNTEAFDLFGLAVAIAGDTVVIGSPAEDSDANGVNGNQSDNSANNAGAAYVFVRDGAGNWSQQAYLKASNSDGGDFFGTSAAITGDTVLVGARSEDSNATGVNGNQSDNSAGGAGAAYVFVRDGAGNWSQQAYLKASNPDVGDNFGNAVTMSGDTVVVGARREDSNATGVNGNQGDNSATDAGSAYVFVRDGAGNWSQQAYLKASNTDAIDRFGTSVAMTGDTVVVGARFEDSNATGVNGNQADNSSELAGAAYVFVRDGSGNWVQQAYLKASNTDAIDRFGDSVAIAGDTVVIGALGEDSNATGVNGNQADNSASESGAVYVFDMAFSIGGTVSGLAGSGLVLQNNAGDDLTIAADGAFTFATSLPDGSAYNVTVSNQPTGPSQTCTVTNGSGTISAADVTNVQVDCVTSTFTIGGTVSGLGGTGLMLQNNGGDDLSVSADGAFTFTTPLADGSAYDVAVLTQPTGLSQTCTVANASGTLMGADVTNVAVTCTTDQFTVGGTVTGLNGSGLVLQNNGGDDLAIVADGAFTFATALGDGSAYNATVATQPTGPIQTCTVSNGSGTLAGANVTNVVVECVDEPPEVELSAGVIDFGVVGFGSSTVQTLTVTNIGSGELVISAITDPLAPFALTGGTCLPPPNTLSPGASCTVDVEFAPNSNGSLFTASFDIVSNAATSPDTVSLSGSSSAIAVPALSRTGLLLLTLLLAGLGWVAVGRRQSH